jgi:chromosome segregation ATPase
LEATAKALETELAGWRRRCLKAEGELDEAARRVAPMTTGDAALLRQRGAELEAENQRLRERITTAREQIEQLRTRLRFVEEVGRGEFA